MRTILVVALAGYVVWFVGLVVYRRTGKSGRHRLVTEEDRLITKDGRMATYWYEQPESDLPEKPDDKYTPTSPEVRRKGNRSLRHNVRIRLHRVLRRGLDPD